MESDRQVLGAAAVRELEAAIAADARGVIESALPNSFLYHLASYADTGPAIKAILPFLRPEELAASQREGTALMHLLRRDWHDAEIGLMLVDAMDTTALTVTQGRNCATILAARAGRKDILRRLAERLSPSAFRSGGSVLLKSYVRHDDVDEEVLSILISMMPPSAFGYGGSCKGRQIGDSPLTAAIRRLPTVDIHFAVYALLEKTTVATIARRPSLAACPAVTACDVGDIQVLRAVCDKVGEEAQECLAIEKAVQKAASGGDVACLEVLMTRFGKECAVGRMAGRYMSLVIRVLGSPRALEAFPWLMEQGLDVEWSAYSICILHASFPSEAVATMLAEHLEREGVHSEHINGWPAAANALHGHLRKGTLHRLHAFLAAGCEMPQPPEEMLQGAIKVNAKSAGGTCDDIVYLCKRFPHLRTKRNEQGQTPYEVAREMQMTDEAALSALRVMTKGAHA